MSSSEKINKMDKMDKKIEKKEICKKKIKKDKKRKMKNPYVQQSLKFLDNTPIKDDGRPKPIFYCPSKAKKSLLPRFDEVAAKNGNDGDTEDFTSDEYFEKCVFRADLVVTPIVCKYKKRDSSPALTPMSKVQLDVNILKEEKDFDTEPSTSKEYLDKFVTPKKNNDSKRDPTPSLNPMSKVQLDMGSSWADISGIELLDVDTEESTSEFFTPKVCNESQRKLSLPQNPMSKVQLEMASSSEDTSRIDLLDGDVNILKDNSDFDTAPSTGEEFVTPKVCYESMRDPPPALNPMSKVQLDMRSSLADISGIELLDVDVNILKDEKDFDTEESTSEFITPKVCNESQRDSRLPINPISKVQLNMKYSSADSSGIDVHSSPELKSTPKPIMPKPGEDNKYSEKLSKDLIGGEDPPAKIHKIRKDSEKLSKNSIGAKVPPAKRQEKNKDFAKLLDDSIGAKDPPAKRQENKDFEKLLKDFIGGNDPPAKRKIISKDSEKLSKGSIGSEDPPAKRLKKNKDSMKLLKDSIGGNDPPAKRKIKKKRNKRSRKWSSRKWSPGERSPREWSPRKWSPRESSPMEWGPRKRSPRERSSREWSLESGEWSPRNTSSRKCSPRKCSPRRSPRRRSPWKRDNSDGSSQTRSDKSPMMSNNKSPKKTTEKEKTPPKRRSARMNIEFSTAEKKKVEEYNCNTFNAREELDESALFSPMPKSGKRNIIIDGNNVAYAHNQSKRFSVEGIRFSLLHFEKQGHKAKAVIPMNRRSQHQSTNPQLLEQLYKEGKIVFTPCKNIFGKKSACYDDRFILQLAFEWNAVVISNDNYRDLANESPAFAEIVKNGVVGFSWCDNIFVLPRDPYGRRGPQLCDILRC